jgi:hypothetical protein
MARYSKIDRRMWADEKFRRLNAPQPCGQALFIYLLTNPFVGVVPGLYSAGAAMLAEALQWNIEAFRDSFQELLREGLVKADFEARLLWIPNAIRYNQPENPNVVKGWQCAWDELPECVLKREAWESLRENLSDRGNDWVVAFVSSCPEPSAKGSAKGMPKGLRKGSAKGMANQEQEQEQEQEKEQPALDLPTAADQPNATEAARYVCHELGLAGKEMIWTISDVIENEVRIGKDAPEAIAESLVRIRRSYEEQARGNKFVWPPKAFFAQGIWNKPQQWRNENGTESQVPGTTRKAEKQLDALEAFRQAEARRNSRMGDSYSHSDGDGDRPASHEAIRR